MLAMVMYDAGGVLIAEWLCQRNAGARGKPQPTQHLLAGVHRDALWSAAEVASYWLRRRSTRLLV